METESLERDNSSPESLLKIFFLKTSRILTIAKASPGKIHARATYTEKYTRVETAMRGSDRSTFETRAPMST